MSQMELRRVQALSPLMVLSLLMYSSMVFLFPNHDLLTANDVHTMTRRKKASRPLRKQALKHPLMWRKIQAATGLTAANYILTIRIDEASGY